MRTNPFTNIAYSIVVIATLAILGCGGTSDRPDLGQVTGTVTLDGTPLPNVIVYLWPTAGGRTSEAITDDAGKYEMIYSPGVNGVKLGVCQVRVTTPEALDGAPISSDDIRSKIPNRYENESELTYEVVEGSQVYDIELTTE